MLKSLKSLTCKLIILLLENVLKQRKRIKKDE